MGDFTVELFDRAYGRVGVPETMRVRPLRWGATARGGPDFAEIEITGERAVLWRCLQWLRYTLHIRNEFGDLVWWGYVHEAIVDAGGAALGLSLETMHNKVTVIYSHVDANGESTDAETAAAQNTTVQGEWGIKELRHSAGDTTPTAAEKLRDTLLNWQQSPTPIAEQGQNAEVATLRCRGWYETLAWRYYADATGRQTYETGGGEQLLGWVLSSTLIGFTANKRIHHQGRSLGALRVGDGMVVSGASDGTNNGTKTVREAPGMPEDDEPRTYTGTDIGFEPMDDIVSLERQLGFLQMDDMIEVSGTVDNNGWYWVDKTGARNIAVVDTFAYPIVTEGNGDSFTIKQSMNIRVDEALVNDTPGDSVVMTLHGQQIACKWTPASGAWPVDEILIQVCKRNGPTDNVKVELCADNAGAPGTVLADATVAGTALYEEMDWHTFTLSAPVTCTALTWYWIVISRTGTATSANYYAVGMDDDAGDAAAEVQLYTGSAWVAREPVSDLPYQVWGLRENTDQIEDIVTACGQFIAGTDVQTTSSIRTRYYRDGTTTGADEIDALLDQGTSTGGRLLAWVDAARWLHIAAEPTASSSSDLLIGRTGRLLRADGQAVARGLVPAGKWAAVQDLPPIGALAPLSPLFLERVEYDAEADSWGWEPRGAPSLDTMPTRIVNG